MKIGILTHHYVKNYGAFLQAKALMETLKKKYPEANIEFVNYVVTYHWLRNVIHTARYRFDKDTPKKYAERIKLLKTHTKFEHQLPIGKRVRTAKDINNLGLDVLIVGSDEVWNFKDYGFGILKYGTGIKVPNLIAYAPSVGAVQKDDEIPEDIIKGLNNFDSIAVRDENSVSIVFRATGKKVNKVVDPVFLYDYEKELKEVGNRVVPNKKYLLIYDCKLTEKFQKSVIAYAKEKGYLIVGAGEHADWYDVLSTNLDPFEWVTLFKNAEFVITGTFHGTAFSVKFFKNFLSFPTETNRINKIRSLLIQLGLEERLADETNFEKLLNSEIPYDEKRNYLNSLIDNSKKYLYKAIESKNK